MNAGAPERWGFCAGCERWRFSAGWGDPPRCSACGRPPELLEELSGDTARLRLVLELPPGSELPLLS